MKLSDDYKLNQLDNIMLKSGSFFSFTIQNKIYINFSPTNNSKSELLYINKNNQIFKSKEQPERFIKGSATNDTFIGLTDKSIKVYCNIEMKCYGSISLKNADLSSFHYIKLKEKRSEFLILHFKPRSEFTLRIIPVTRNSKHIDITTDNSHINNFEKTISSLQSIILRVKNKLAPVKEKINQFRLKNSTDTLKHLFLNNSVIGEIKIFSKNLLTPSNLWKKVEALQNEVSLLKAQFKIKRPKRSVEASNILSVGKLKVVNLVFTEAIKLPSLHLKNYISTTSLEMEHLNDVPWNEFVSGLANEGTIIKGTIRFQSPVQIKSLRSRKINNLNTKNIFNLLDDQNITSNIFINKGVFSSIINCTVLNGLDIMKDLSKVNANNVINCEYLHFLIQKLHRLKISAHVTIKNIQILNSLKVSEDEEHLRHVFGTHFEDLQQIYTGRVLINGSLTLVNIEVDSNKVFLKGTLEPIDIDFYKDFWLNSLDQVSIYNIV